MLLFLYLCFIGRVTPLPITLMNLSSLTAILPVDGRYRKQTEPLSEFFSEYALIKYRVYVEIEYLIALSDELESLAPLRNPDHHQTLRNIFNNFNEDAAKRIKEIEGVTNHDVKAVEYYIKEQITNPALAELKEFVHFGLTSQDINNTAQPLMLKEALTQVWLPQLKKVRDALANCAKEWAGIPMLARTHGQPASPTKYKCLCTAWTNK